MSSHSFLVPNSFALGCLTHKERLCIGNLTANEFIRASMEGVATGLGNNRELSARVASIPLVAPFLWGRLSSSMPMKASESGNKVGQGYSTRRGDCEDSRDLSRQPVQPYGPVNEDAAVATRSMHQCFSVCAMTRSRHPRRRSCYRGQAKAARWFQLQIYAG